MTPGSWPAGGQGRRAALSRESVIGIVSSCFSPLIRSTGSAARLSDLRNSRRNRIIPINSDNTFAWNCHFDRNEVGWRNPMGSLDLLRTRGCRPFSAENCPPDSFPGASNLGMTPEMVPLPHGVILSNAKDLLDSSLRSE